MKTKSKISEIREKLHPDSASCKDGTYTCRWGFFYTNGRTTEGYEKKVMAAFPEATILASREVWKPFRGGASVANSSHFSVTFRLDGSRIA